MKIYPALALLTCCQLSQAAETNHSDLAKSQFIQQQLEQQSDHSELWQWGWFGFLAGTGTAQAIGSQVIDNRDMQYDMRVGAVKSLLGAADLLVNPMKTHSYAAELAQMPEQTPEQQAKKAEQAEIMLKQAVEREEYEQSWVNHTLSGVVNLAGSALIGIDDERPAAALLDFAVGMLVSEIKIYSAPQKLSESLALYQSGDYQALTSNTARKAAMPTESQWQIAVLGRQLQVDYRF